MPKDVYHLYHPLTWSNKVCGGRGNRGALIEKEEAHGKETLLKYNLN
jgi:hypothetical protein